MTETLITPTRARGLAKRFFLATFPDGERWFELAWDTALAQRPADSVSKQSTEDSLHAIGGVDGATMDMARDFAILFETFLQKYPIAQEALIESLEASCAKHGKNPRATQRLAVKLRQNLKQEGDFVVWTATELQSKTSFDYISTKQAEAYVKKEGAYDIFINGETVSIKVRNGRESLALPPRLYSLLIMFLRYRSRPLPPEESYRKAWGHSVTLPNSDLKSVLRDHLRFAVSDLRTKLSKVGKFEIPDKQRDHGYRCEGQFSFCIILDRDFEPRVTLKIT